MTMIYAKRNCLYLSKGFSVLSYKVLIVKECTVPKDRNLKLKLIQNSFVSQKNQKRKVRLYLLKNIYILALKVNISFL